MAATQPVTTEHADGIALVRLSSPPVNALGAAVRAGLLDALRRAEADAAVRGIVLAAEGRVFCAGADISEFGRTPVPPVLSELLAAMDALGKPVVAAIDGAVLGGGLELVLCCHARLASPAAKLGLPEVKLGLLPGAGGTQRLPRLVGAVPALKLMTDGTPLRAADAVKLGLVKLVEGDLLAAARDEALALAGKPLPRSRDAEGLGPREAFEGAAAAIAKKNQDDPGIQACVDAVRGAFELPFDQALAREHAHFRRLLQDDRSRAMRHAFFAERAAAQIVGLSKGTAARRIGKVAVIGAGTMGGGIAMCFANAGIPVTVIETGEEALRRGLERVGKTYDISVGRGSLTQEKRDARMALISGQVGLEAAADADIVIEAVFEEMGVKKEVFATLDRVARPGAILATNTSYLDVDEIAAATSRPQDVLGMHFFSPANVMKLLEVVRGANTAPDVLATAGELGRRIGKVPVTVGVCYGFVGNRMLSKRGAEVERLLLEGALPQEIDRALTEFGFRMGPCAMGDLAGLDIGWRIRQATGKSAPVADALVEAGRLGQKTGKGYYLYPEGARAGQPDPEVETLVAGIAERHGVARRSVPQDEILERLLFPMINEGARILEEGIAARPGDIDVVWLYGYGWPASRGGPMFFADLLGLPRIAARLEEFAGRSGDASLRPAPLLRRLAESGGSFAAQGAG